MKLRSYAWILGLIGYGGLFAPEVCRAQQSLPFTNLPSISAANIQGHVSSNLVTAYSSTTNEERSFKGVFTPSTPDTKIAIHSDDGCNVKLDGVLKVSKFGQNTHLESLSSSFNEIGATFIQGEEYCVQIDFKNLAYTAGDLDGVTLYSYNGGGSVRSGVIVRGSKQICAGAATTYWVECGGVPPYTWTSSDATIATVNDGVVTGLKKGSSTISVVDSIGQSGSRTITVLHPKIFPSAFTNCAGSTNVFTLGDAELTGTVSWSPSGGFLSADTKTYSIALNSGNHLITANWQGCESRATGVVVAVSSLTASPVHVCRNGQVIYTAQTSPPGYEHLVNWGDGVGAKRTNTYSTPGTYTKAAWCGNSALFVNNFIHGISIVPSIRTVLADAANTTTFYQTNSQGPATWQVQGSGPSISGSSSGDTVAVSSGSNPGTFDITANPTALPGCYSTARLDVVKVTFSSNLLAGECSSKLHRGAIQHACLAGV